MKTGLQKILSGWFLILFINLNGQPLITDIKLLNEKVSLYEKAEWDIVLSNTSFENPYISKEITVDMILVTPSGKQLQLPCFYVDGDNSKSSWKARFAPIETGRYSYYFEVKENNKFAVSDKKFFETQSSGNHGFLHKNNYWTFRFDDGTFFRGIGENIGWESRQWENEKYTYDYLLKTLSDNGANFFRTWMCVWNLPLEWTDIRNTNRYKNTDKYYNPDGINRMDELVDMADSLGLYFMLAIDWHGELIANAEWKNSPYNSANGGPAKSPTEFFTSQKARDRYKNKLRYIVARWGYSTNIAAWEFFNEIDNAAFNPQDSVLIPHNAIAEWHNEMSRYLHDIDIYDHLITTSISHREIMEMNSLPYLDFNQKHIYKHTDWIPETVKTYSEAYNKPYVIGEFSFEWNWEIDFNTITDGLIFDYKRGLWYGLFNQTPVLPMTWWWEFFDEQGMTPYFNCVREISDSMLKAGNGEFEIVKTSSGKIESMAVKCGDVYFTYLLNNSDVALSADAMVESVNSTTYQYRTYNPTDRKFSELQKAKKTDKNISTNIISLNPKDEVVIVFYPEKNQNLRKK